MATSLPRVPAEKSSSEKNYFADFGVTNPWVSDPPPPPALKSVSGPRLPGRGQNPNPVRRWVGGLAPNSCILGHQAPPPPPRKVGVRFFWVLGLQRVLRLVVRNKGLHPLAALPELDAHC